MVGSEPMLMEGRLHGSQPHAFSSTLKEEDDPHKIAVVVSTWACLKFRKTYRDGSLLVRKRWD